MRRFISGLVEGTYGPDFDRPGVATDHVRLALDAGYVVRVAASGRTYVAPASGGTAVPVVCGEIIQVWTEDGPTSGRCGLPVLHDACACPGHAEQIAAWRSQDDYEAAQRERTLDAEEALA